MRVHICLYLNNQEVINFNDVLNLYFGSDYVEVITNYGDFYFRYIEFDRIEVNCID